MIRNVIFRVSFLISKFSETLMTRFTRLSSAILELLRAAKRPHCNSDLVNKMEARSYTEDFRHNRCNRLEPNTM